MENERIYQNKVYLKLEPTFSYYNGELSGFKVCGITQTKPKKPVGYPIIALNLKIPKSVLEPFACVVEIDKLGTIEAELEEIEE